MTLRMSSVEVLNIVYFSILSLRMLFFSLFLLYHVFIVQQF